MIHAGIKVNVTFRYQLWWPWSTSLQCGGNNIIIRVSLSALLSITLLATNRLEAVIFPLGWCCIVHTVTCFVAWKELKHLVHVRRVNETDAALRLLMWLFMCLCIIQMNIYELFWISSSDIFTCLCDLYLLNKICHFCRYNRVVWLSDTSEVDDTLYLECLMYKLATHTHTQYI